jgi:outer membrane protein assembly factor BamA
MHRTIGRRLFLLFAAAMMWPRASRSQSVQCDAGEKEVRDLKFVGNRVFSDDELALRVNTTSSSWARRHLRIVGTRRCLDVAELPRDALRIKLLYRNAGYWAAVVDTSVTRLGSDAVRVTFRIREGRPIIIDSAAVTGLDSVPDASAVRRGLWLAVGKPFDRVRYAADADSIVARLRNDGYPRADVLLDYDADSVALRAHAILDAIPGRRARIDSILIDATPAEGHSREIPDRVVKRLLGISRGDLYRDRDIIRAQRNLYQTGSYRHVEVAPLPDSLLPKGDTLVWLRVTLREDVTNQLDTEIGWATLDCFRTRAQFTDKNFLNGARRLEVTGLLSKIAYGAPLASSDTRKFCYSQLNRDRFSLKTNYYLAATLRQPAVFGTSAVPALSVYTERRGEYLAYLRTILIGGEASLTKDIAANTSGRIGYNLEYGRTEAEPALLCAVFSRCDQALQDQFSKRDRPLAIASVGVTRVRTDNLVNPTLGSVLSGEVRTSARALGSDTGLTFVKGVGDARWYHPLGWGNILALRIRAGAIAGGQGGLTGTRLPPPQERLYAGGATSMRGFQENQLGALLYIARDLDTVRIAGDSAHYLFVAKSNNPLRVIPIGGNSLVVANLDYRVKDPFFPALLQYTLFSDVGEVWTRGAPGLEFKLHWTPGLGLRVFSAVGPIQVNVGYNPYPLPTGAVFFDATINPVTGKAPLYCVSPGNGLPVRIDNGEQQAGLCARTFTPAQPNTFLKKLTFTFSIGPDF